MKPIKIIITLSLIMFINMINAQKNIKFNLLDTNKEPLVGATYEYQNQSGITNENGLISIVYIKDALLELSFLGYGQWQLSDEEILKAASDGFVYREIQLHTLQPITVISLRHKSSEVVKNEFTYQDKVHHDGGSILSQSPLVGGIRKSGSYGFDPVMRGFKYDQLNIVMNGTQCATAACPNRMDPPTSQMAPNMVDRVEILKGPHALRYGGGLGGTINYITTSPSFQAEQNVFGRVTGRYDANGNSLKSEAMVGLSGAKYNLTLFGSIANGDDYISGNDLTVQGDYYRTSLGAQLGLKLTENQTINLSAFNNRAKDTDFPSLMMDLRNDNTLMLNASHAVNFSDSKLRSWTTTLFLSNVDHLMDNGLKPLDPRMMNAKNDAKTNNLGGRTEGLWSYGKAKLYAGADVKIEEAEGKRVRAFLLGPNAGKIFTDNAWQHSKIMKTGVFAEYTSKFFGWNTVLAGRLEFNNGEALEVDPSFEEAYPDLNEMHINPSLSLGGLKNYNNNIALGIWLARAQRSPSLAERYINKFSIGIDPYEMYGNPNLKPEVNNQLDLTLEWKTIKTALSFDVFASYLTDYISSVIDEDIKTLLPTSPGVRSFMNIDKAFKTGFEVNYSQQIASIVNHDFSIAYTYGQDLERDEALPEIAPLDLRYSIKLNLWKNRIQPNLVIRHVIEQSRISSEFGETVTPSFTLVDLNFGLHLVKNWQFQLGVQNLFDVTYYEHLNRSTAGGNGIPLYAQGRNIFASFNYSFE